MNAFFPVLHPEFGSQFCLLLTWALLHFVWQGCLLAIAFALVRRALARSSSNVRYAAGMVILLLMAACLPMNLWLIDPARALDRSVGLKQVSVARPLADDTGHDRMVRVVLADDRSPSAAAAPVAIRPNEGDGRTVWNLAIDRSAAALTSVSTYAAAAYALGLAVMLSRVFVGLSIGRRLRRASYRVSDSDTLELVRRHAVRLALRSVPAIAWCSRVSVPVVIGVLRPMILLPISLATGLTSRQLEYVLLHELAHIHRYDPLANLLQRLIEALLFFHPAMWWLTRQVNIERENACDDAVLRAGCQGEAYGEALLRVAELCASMPGRAVSPAGLLAATGENSNQLSRRIMRLFGAEPQASARPATPAVAMLVLLSAFAVIALAAWRSPAAAQVGGDPAPLAQAETQPGESQPANIAARVLHFPADRAMGEVRWRPAGGDTATPDPDKETHRAWQPLTAAQGDVQVPAGGDVQLRISDAGSRDLGGLNRLAPDDVQFLILQGRNVNDDGLSHVGRLTGLRHLRVYFAPTTDRGILHLAGLKRLQKILLIAPREDRSGFDVGDGAARVLAQLAELQEIDLSGTNLTEAGLAELTKLERLSSLHVGGTTITDAGLAELTKIKSLTSLSLGAAQITPDGLAALKQLPALERLALGAGDNASPATDAGLVHLGALTNLKRLAVANSQITDAGLAHLKQLTRLENLSLDNTNVTEAGLAELEPLRSLQELRISPDHFTVTDVGAAHLARLKSLRKFTGNLQLTDEGLKALATLPNLEELRLHGQGVTDAGIEHIAGMKSLKSLGFTDCQITDVGLARLAEFSQIEELILFGNNGITGDGLASLAAARQLTKLSVGVDERNIHQAIGQVGKLTQLKSLGITGSAPFHDLSPLAGLVNLENLDCWVSPVNNLDAVQIAKLRSLKTLMLRRTMITDSGFEQFSQLEKLEFLRVDGFFSDKGLSSLGGLKSLNILQLASPYVSQAAVDVLAAELPALQTITVSDNDPLRRSRERAGKQGSQEKPATPLGAAGSSLSVGAVKFIGNTITSGQRLKTQIESKPPILGLFKGQYDEEKIDDDIEKLIAYYRNLGFFRARVTREAVVDEKSKRPTVTFVIDEGPRYRVGGVRFDGDRRFSEAQLREAMALKEGEFFGRKNLDQDLKRLNEMHRAYLSSSIQPQFEFDDEAGTVTVVFNIQEADYMGRLGVAR